MKKPSIPPRSAHMPGLVRRKPSAVSASGKKASFGRRERIVRDATARQGSRDAGLALLGLQRTDRVDQPPARAQHADGGGQQPVLRRRSAPARRAVVSGAGRRDGGGSFRWHCTAHPAGWRRTALAGASRGIGLHRLGLQTPAPQVILQPREPHRVALDGDNRGTGRSKLGSLAARGGAEVGNPFARLRREQSGGQSGGRVLHPEIALRRSLAISVTRVPAGKRTEPVGSISPPGGTASRACSVTSSGASLLVGHRRWRAPCRPRTPRARPACPGAAPSSSASAARPSFGHTAQHGIDQAGEGRQPAGTRQRDRGGDGGMARRIQQQEPRGAQAQHVAHRFRRRLAQERLEHRVQRSHPPQHRRGQPMRRGTVAAAPAGERVQCLLERPAPVQHRGQQIECGLARRVRPSARGGTAGHLAPVQPAACQHLVGHRIDRAGPALAHAMQDHVAVVRRSPGRGAASSRRCRCPG